MLHTDTPMGKRWAAEEAVRRNNRAELQKKALRKSAEKIIAYWKMKNAP